MDLWALLLVLLFILLFVIAFVAASFIEKKYGKKIFYISLIGGLFIALIICITFFNPKIIPKSFLVFDIINDTATLESLEAKKTFIEETSGYSDKTKNEMSLELTKKISKIETEIYENEELLEEKLIHNEKKLLRKKLKRVGK